MNLLQENELLYKHIIIFRDKAVTTSQILILACSVLYILYTAYQSMQHQKPAKYGPVFADIAIVVIALATYSYWTVWIAETITLIAKEIGTPDLMTLTDVVATAYKNMSITPKEEANADEGLMVICMLISLLCVKGAAFVFKVGHCMSQALLWILGPFSIVFSLLPNFSKAFVQWFGSFIAVCFWLVVFTILANLFNDLMLDKLAVFIKNGATIKNNSMGDVADLLVYSLTFLIAIVIIPKITSAILPIQDVIGTVSTFTGAVAMLATLPIGKLKGLIGKK